jgi:hypothetical protein
MKHEEEVIYHKYDPRKDFVQKDFYESVVPILTDSGIFPDNIIGTGFLINNGDGLASYIVTAKHVLRGEKNPNIMLTSKSGTQMQVGSETLELFGAKWMSHPEGLDLIAIPLLLPKRLDDKIRNRRIVVNSKLDPSKIKMGAQVKHIGYGGKMTGKNKKTGELLGLPGAAFGTYESGTQKIIKIRSACIEGDSGSPLFLNRGKGISIIGVLVRGKPLKQEEIQTTNIVGNTTALPIEHIFKILNSKQMKAQVLSGLDKIKSLDRIM